MTDVTFLDCAVYIPQKKTLVISDLHLGYEESASKKGILVPRFQFKEILQKLERIANVLPSLERIVINGDLKHEFGTITETEWRYCVKLIDFLHTIAKRVILIEGNHDAIIKPIAKKKKVTLKTNYVLGNVLITHGDEMITQKGISTIIIGHDHCAITLRKNRRSETYKCFLKGTWRKKTLIAMPSFHTLTIGSDVLTQRLLSPYLESIDDFEVIVVHDEIYKFGTIDQLRKIKTSP